ncbi:30S ribosomal protein S4 [Candidatus Falkowbacteria bacterium CG_4_9_14_3_um_filter_36_9]|uniref:Small ribosomal subunit protein uS4 n=2 Tax=Candidatus Falkowiibacteriota TaxID=1752728 RepID=A0A1J4T9X0_9BACT|nr:MAG: 30S ribosomal protein S4 [Candidatus Falkowbacteria bacterium CG1_02_37_44]PIV51676.1 MAG: 30S ribosomal protein S4 [Candidatus Falkowbacteria bacterium CG02_land_8_20_14_3_00_36_14]PIX12363.1 MAG: 30S ribosomal protein S4 [Candidatus Falkowbacteria bacterium CG_4_8_14_3_um_filter_36_11]PJA10707.1 MAG: 30S ribosomal protein S4 [Candidatus Falkowbacteria bacterium CG_4_10_14_0_2_um_filter_36_22]PJB20791.1 MAG: 30S ribosomal protein S4 [Candidatus Falkowbacteria bacterium CG_4_9_14_3_um_f
MARNLNPQCKQCRRIGEKLFLKGERCLSQKCAIVKRNYPPGAKGMAGAKGGRQRRSDYGLQLLEKQKIKKQYQLLEKQFKLTFLKASKLAGDKGENFLKLLETRFDNIIYRFGYATSRNTARQLINHGHFMINNKKVNIPSYQVKEGDIIAINPTSFKLKPFNKLDEIFKKAEVPGWLNLDKKEKKGKVMHLPGMADIKCNINLPLVVEYYSR